MAIIVFFCYLIKENKFILLKQIILLSDCEIMYKDCIIISGRFKPMPP